MPDGTMSMARPSRGRIITSIIAETPAEGVVVASNGFIARETWALRTDRVVFPMLGSMGLAAPIALGIALQAPRAPVLCLEGDGNAAMGLAVLPLVGELAPSNFLHIVLCDGAYSSTGGQRCPHAELARLAAASGYLWNEEWDECAPGLVDRFWRRGGPGLACFRIEPDPQPSAERIGMSPLALAAAVSAHFEVSLAD